jgi:hypothetical protein
VALSSSVVRFERLGTHDGETYATWRNGSTWLTLPQPPTVKGYTNSPGTGVVAASSVSNAWVFTGAANTSSGADFTAAQRWNGSKWVNQSVFPAWHIITSAVTSSSKDAWVFGQNFSSSAVPYTAHWNGQSWTKVSLQLTVASVSALSGSDIWALGQQLWQLGTGHHPQVRRLAIALCGALGQQ